MRWAPLLALVASTIGNAQDIEFPTGELTPLVLDLRLAGLNKGEVRVLRDREGNFFVSEADLKAWGLSVPNAILPPIQYGAQRFLSLALKDEPGVHFDEEQQSLSIDIPAEWFTPTVVDLRGTTPDLTVSGLGAYLNYDAYAEVVSGLPQSERGINALIDTGLFGRFGSLLGSATLTDQQHISGASAADVRRLDTSWVRDDPRRLNRLTVGDSIGAGGFWGRPLRFGGVRYSRNFDLLPGFVTQPLPALSGEAGLPSTVDVFLNGLLQARSEVPPGPFTIREIPMTGSYGQVEMVVTDILGRETRLVTSFASSSSMLKPGLTDFSFEGGAMRLDYGRESANYGDTFGAATVRRGLSERLTVEGRGEATREHAAAGVGAATIVGGARLQLTGAIALSQSDEGTGHRVTSTLQTMGTRRLSAGVALQASSREFRQLGMPADLPSPRYVLAGNASVSLGRHATMTISHAVNASRTEATLRVTGVSTSRRMGRFGLLTLAAQLASGRVDTRMITLNYATSLNLRDSLGVNSTRMADGAGSQIAAHYSHSRASELGLDWSAYANRNESGSGGALAASLATRSLTAGARLDGAAGATRLQASLSGGLGVIGGSAFASRRITNSFGLVRVGDIPGIDVYVENQLAGRTDAEGHLVVPRLVEFTSNRIRIDAAQLPADAEISGSDEQEVVPHYRNGVVLDFAVRRVRSALVELRLPNGVTVPRNAAVQWAATSVPFYVAERGEVYVTDVPEGRTALHVDWMAEDGTAMQCRAELSFPANAGPQPRIGPLTCVP